MSPLSPSSLRDLAVEILVAAGADPDEAGQVADVLVWADRRGRFPQGTIWLDALSARLSDGDLVSPAPMTVTTIRPASSRIDCGNGLGHVAGHKAVAIVADGARTYGVSSAVVVESAHFGPCGYYAARLAELGLVGIVATNAYPKVAAHGSRAAVLGTNPIAFAAPSCTGRPIVGDLSTGSLAGSRVREAKAAGTELDVGMALDRDGEPTVDPVALDDGGVMLPFGGAKGFALGLLVEMLTSVLGDGAAPDALGSMFTPGPPRTSHFVLALAGDGEIGGRADDLRSLVLGAPARPGFEVRLPGDHGREHDERHTEVVLPPDSVRGLVAAAERVGVDTTRLDLS